MNVCRQWLLPVGIATGFFLAAASASTQEIKESDAQIWIQYDYQFRISEKWRGSWDVAYRELVSTEDVLGEWSRLHTRGLLNYVHTNWATFEGGIAGYYTFADDLSDLFEFRTWQGAILFWPVTKLAQRELDFRHRFRLEQRWIRQEETGERDFGFRIRYRLATFIPLNRAVIEEKTWYMPLMGEAFADLGGDSPDYFAERLRLSIGVGHVLSKNWTLEFRYTAQKARDTVLNRFMTTDHILDIRIRTGVRIRDMLR